MEGGNGRSNNTTIIYKPGHWSLSNHELTILLKYNHNLSLQSKKSYCSVNKKFLLKLLLNINECNSKNENIKLVSVSEVPLRPFSNFTDFLHFTTEDLPMDIFSSCCVVDMNFRQLLSACRP